MLKGQRAGWPQRLGGAQWVRPVRLVETPRSAARRTPPRGFKPPPPGGAQPIGSSTTTVTSPGPERQLLGGALPLRVSPGTRPHKLHLQAGSQLESGRLLQALRERPPRGDRRPPTKVRRGSSRGATGPRRGRAEPASLRIRPGTRPRSHLRLAPRARPGRAPTHPSRAVAGRARTVASRLPPPLLLPIFPSRLVDVPVGAASHFAPFVLKQILHPLPFRRQLRLEIIIHCLLPP